MLRFIPAAFLLAFLSACASSIDTQDEVVVLTQAAVYDLKAAKTDADAHEDIVASTCYGKLIERLSTLPALTEGRVIGPVTGFQKARNARRRLDAGISDEVHLACAALLADTRATVLRVTKLLGVVLP